MQASPRDRLGDPPRPGADRAPSSRSSGSGPAVPVLAGGRDDADRPDPGRPAARVGPAPRAWRPGRSRVFRLRVTGDRLRQRVELASWSRSPAGRGSSTRRPSNRSIAGPASWSAWAGARSPAASRRTCGRSRSAPRRCSGRPTEHRDRGSGRPRTPTGGRDGGTLRPMSAEQVKPSSRLARFVPILGWSRTYDRRVAARAT